MAAPKTCILKVNLHCAACEKKVHKELKKVDGVHSIDLDGKHGRVTVSGNMDPCMLIMALTKAGKKAELLWQHTPDRHMNHHHQNYKSSQYVQPRPAEQFDSDLDGQIAQLHKLSQVERLNQVEVTQSKSLKVTFKRQKDNASEENMKIGLHPSMKIGLDNVHGHYCAGPSHATDAPCGACWHDYGTSSTHKRCGSISPPACRSVPPPPNADNHHPRCPPPPPPPVAYPYHPGMFRDDNPGGCNLM